MKVSTNFSELLKKFLVNVVEILEQLIAEKFY